MLLMNLKFGQDLREDGSLWLCVASAVRAHLGLEDPLSQCSAHMLAQLVLAIG